MNKPIRREFLRKLVKEHIILTKKYEWWTSTKMQKYYGNPEEYHIYRRNRKTHEVEYLGIWEYK